MIFSPQQKDEWLKFLLLRTNNSDENFGIIDDEFLKGKEMTLNKFRPLMEYFERLNFIELQLNNWAGISYYFRQEAIDFLGRGGFVAQEDIFENNIEKLLLEIDNLKKELAPDKLDTINKLTSIGNSILSGLNIISSIKNF